MKDLLILGAGPAGLTASIYAIRAGLNASIIEKLAPGGQVMNTDEVENYPGFEDPIKGWELMSRMEKQSRRLGVDIISGEVTKIEKNNAIFNVSLSDGSVKEAKAVIIATGASLKRLGVPGEEKNIGRGVSYCATCDGAFYKDKITAVVGGGDTALEEALLLRKFAKKIYLIHRRDVFRGAKILQDRVLSSDIIEPLYDSVVESINGENKVETLTIKTKDKDSHNLSVDGVFIFVGYEANTKFLEPHFLNSYGEVKVAMSMETDVKGLFAVGDCRSDSKRQIVMACADGATAVMNAYEYIENV